MLRILLMFVLIAVALTAYIIGYGRGHRAAVYDRLVYDVGADLHFYRLSVAGDTNQLQSLFRFCVFRDSDYYDRYFSGVTVTDQYFIQELADARAIANQERTNVVSVASITNYLPANMKLKIEQDK
ncbi:MAG TPA: hypothetical protein VMD27_10900 [Candidatus Aquilonibacter sp.]|nr:hypothetical protein [Candidatus Aquilonibacter sp.]